MILYNSCSYDNEFIDANIFIKDSNDILIRRVIIQEMQYQEKKIYGKKHYIFYPNSIDNELIFIYDKNKFMINFDKKYSIKYTESENENNKEEFNKQLLEGVKYESKQSWINDIIAKDKLSLKK